MTRGELKYEFYAALSPLNEADKFDAIDTVLGHVIAALRADHAIPARSRTDWELVLADAVKRAADDLYWLEGMVDEGEAVQAMLEALLTRWWPSVPKPIG